MVTRYCRQCKEYYQTPFKYSKVCFDCKEKNRQNKNMKNLFGKNILLVTTSVR